MSHLTTPEALIDRYAADIAFVTETPAATTPEALIQQLGVAADRLGAADIIGAEDIGAAASYLADALAAEPGRERQILLRRAARHLAAADDAVDEYREMV
ncbi:hypothetical protein [Streptomyces hoynatensis]|uniref:Uncharacterized protein n=1 Tax=Streptomyces hoynatensis TaxID=1141874 RepID=A0A3A9YYG6_9ACTN|nr:hypothetical protein [Streptomyces hoynatensis]RKN40789.1 hypothetical protein D7294_17015 [Streptomyces hoynatensis]